MNIEITTPTGEVKTIALERFAALDGWEIQANFIRFAASQDKDFRRAFTLEVLSYASIVMAADRAIPLKTSALIDNHLGSWENVQHVFEEVLKFNGIDPKTHANQPHYWAEAGAQMAVAFVAECSQLLGPAIQFATQKE